MAEVPDERYKDISELKKALSELLERFLEQNYTAVLTLNYEIFKTLKSKNLIPKNSKMADLKTVLPSNFFEPYIYQDGEKYIFLGTNYYFECVYNVETNIFMVTEVKKVVPLNREIMKKSFVEYPQNLIFLIPNLFIN